MNKIKKPVIQAPKPILEPDFNFGEDNNIKLVNVPQPVTNYFYDRPTITKSLTKKEEEESNLIRIDLDEAAKKVASHIMEAKGVHRRDLEDDDEFLENYDNIYSILYKAKA